MFTSRFDYYAPATVQEAVALLGQHKDAKVLAGGHSLLPTMKLRLSSPPVLVDIGKIDNLRGIRAAGDRLVIGALTTHATIAASQQVAAQCKALSEAAALIGDRQVRNRGTIGGSLSHADPAADYPAVMVALGAEIHAVGPKGERTIKADDFFQSMMTTALQPDEVLTEIRIPTLAPHSGCAYVKFPHPASRFAIVGVCAMVTVDGQGTVTQARIGVTGACEKAMRAKPAEAALQGKKLDDAGIAGAAQHAAEGLECLGDIHASPEYRAHLVGVLTGRALKAAADRAK